MSSPELDTRTLILQATWKLMEQHRGQNVRIQDIAKLANVSRQAVYLHFNNRTELLTATTHYLDEMLDVEGRINWCAHMNNGVEQLEAYVDFWGNYIPEIYGLAKALIAAQDTDEAAAAAWRDRMEALRRGCRGVVEQLGCEGKLAPLWSPEKAEELFWSMLSISVWENLTGACGWTKEEYVRGMQAGLKRMLVR
jgi:AcrR family transcriptional regulator